MTATLCDRGNTAAAVELLVAAYFGDPTAAVANVTEALVSDYCPVVRIT